MSFKERLRRPNDDWAGFLGALLVVMCLVASTTLVAIGFSSVGDYDEVTRQALREVGGTAVGAFVLLGMVMWQSIRHNWSPSPWFYCGVLLQGLYVAKYLFASGLMADRVAVGTVLVSGICFALDANVSARSDKTAQTRLAKAEAEVQRLRRRLEDAVDA